MSAHATRPATLLGAMLSTLLGCADEPPATRDPAQDRARFEATLAAVRAGMARHDVPGAAVAVVLDGRPAFGAGLGVRARATGAPVTPQTLFRTGSLLSKPLVAATLLDLAEDRRVDLDAPLARYLPDLVTSDVSAPLTLHQALSMQSGLALTGYRASCADPSIGAYLRNRPLPAHAAPAEFFQYAAVGYEIGAAAVEVVAGRSWEAEALARVARPMGLAAVTFDGDAARALDHAVGHGGTAAAPETWDLHQLPWCPQGGCTACSETRASAGLIASVDDVARWVAQMLVPQGPLARASVARMVAPHASVGAGWSYGYGTFRGTVRGVPMALGVTAYAGVSACMAWAPERGVGAAILTNREAGAELAQWLDDQCLDAVSRFLGLSGALPRVEPSPESYPRFVGRYADTRQPTVVYEVAQDPATRALTLTTPGAAPRCARATPGSATPAPSASGATTPPRPRSSISRRVAPATATATS